MTITMPEYQKHILREAVAELTVLRDRQERREQQWRLASGLRRRLADAGKEGC